MKARINDRHQDRAVAALRAQRRVSGGRDSAHAVGQEAGAADQEAAARPSLEKVINREAMANPGCLDWYLDFARSYLGKQAGAA
jgi:hypothetical protein